MHLFRAARNALAIACCVALWSATAYLQAQSNAGEVRLTVKDPSGAPIVASGILRNAATGAARAFKTDRNGTYILENLPLGRYRLEVTKSGFAVESSLIEVRSSTPVERTVRMVLAPQAAEIAPETDSNPGLDPSGPPPHPTVLPSWRIARL